MPGPRPKPSHLKLVKGNPGRRPINKNEPKPRAATPTPPPHLSDTATRAWPKVCAMLAKMGVLTKADAIAVEMLCEAYADHQAAHAALKAFGSSYYTTETESGSVMHRAHPAVAAVADADRRLRGWLAEFGLTPSARSKVQTAPAAEDDDASSIFFD